jgi:hypothetical protein
MAEEAVGAQMVATEKTARLIVEAEVVAAVQEAVVPETTPTATVAKTEAAVLVEGLPWRLR